MAAWLNPTSNLSSALLLQMKLHQTGAVKTFLSCKQNRKILSVFDTILRSWPGAQ